MPPTATSNSGRIKSPHLQGSVTVRLIPILVTFGTLKSQAHHQAYASLLFTCCIHGTAKFSCIQKQYGIWFQNAIPCGNWNRLRSPHAVNDLESFLPRLLALYKKPMLNQYPTQRFPPPVILCHTSSSLLPFHCSIPGFSFMPITHQRNNPGCLISFFPN